MQATGLGKSVSSWQCNHTVFMPIIKRPGDLGSWAQGLNPSHWELHDREQMRLWAYLPSSSGVWGSAGVKIQKQGLLTHSYISMFTEVHRVSSSEFSRVSQLAPQVSWWHMPAEERQGKHLEFHLHHGPFTHTRPFAYNNTRQQAYNMRHKDNLKLSCNYIWDLLILNLLCVCVGFVLFCF